MKKRAFQNNLVLKCPNSKRELQLFLLYVFDSAIAQIDVQASLTYLSSPLEHRI